MGRKTQNGYRQVLAPDHPRADQNGYVMEHILVWELKTGVMVPHGCCIHHLNGDKTDNRISNLCMMEVGAHTTFHHTGSHRSEATKEILSDIAKRWFATKENHPAYKAVDVAGMVAMRNAGATVKEVCLAYGIVKSTYYKKMEEYHVSQ